MTEATEKKKTLNATKMGLPGGLDDYLPNAFLLKAKDVLNNFLYNHIEIISFTSCETC